MMFNPFIIQAELRSHDYRLGGCSFCDNAFLNVSRWSLGLPSHYHAIADSKAVQACANRTSYQHVSGSLEVSSWHPGAGEPNRGTFLNMVRQEAGEINTPK